MTRKHAVISFPHFFQVKCSLCRRMCTVWFFVALFVCFSSCYLNAQISLTTAVDLALRNSPRVKVAEADVAKARAALEESRDVYIPSLTAGAGLGQSYGFSLNPPTLFTFNAQSLVYNASQAAYIRSARSALVAATLTLQDVRAAVIEDAALTFVALDRDQQREEVLRQQLEYATRLVIVVEERLKAGRDRGIDLTSAQLLAAQFRLSNLRARDETANDQGHLAGLMAISPVGFRVESGFPTKAIALDAPSSSHSFLPPSVAAAFATATVKQQVAFGDARFLYRPQVSLVAQYNLYATWTSSFTQLQSLYSANNPRNKIGANEGVFGVQINLPLFDKLRQAKNRESAAEASRAFHEAEVAQANALDGQSKSAHTIEELRIHAEIATLDRQLAQQQLEIVLIQMNVATSSAGTPLTPKDEQNSRIAEREKFLLTLDANSQLYQAEINLLRQTGQLESWLKEVAISPMQVVSPTPK